MTASLTRPAAGIGQSAHLRYSDVPAGQYEEVGEEMSVASQRLMENVTYEDLYQRWEQGNWSAYDIDFSADRPGWAGLSDIQRRSAMWIYSMFFYGEDRVADTLAPYITASQHAAQAYFLATQQVDEV